jgi:excinuclease ABC subunit B
VIIDESHQSVPQLGAMFKGDRSRKTTLVEYGFRLPSALDNRPLSFDEFEKLAKTRIYVSATPGPYELLKCEGEIIEQVVRPTGLIDPEVIIKPVENQVDDLMMMIREQVEAGHRTLVACMTKRQAEDLTDYYQGLDLRVKYLHSDIVTLERLEIIRELRSGEFDTLIGINLLREGLDIPEVGLVAILNADMEGFLRSETSIIQTSGRAARNVDGIVVLYADRITGSIERAMDEMSRRRERQIAYNKKNGITPKSVFRNLESDLGRTCENDYVTVSKDGKDSLEFMPKDEVARLIRKYEKEMKEAAGRLEFETAAEVSDKIKKLREFAI